MVLGVSKQEDKPLTLPVRTRYQPPAVTPQQVKMNHPRKEKVVKLTKPVLQPILDLWQVIVQQENNLRSRQILKGFALSITRYEQATRLRGELLTLSLRS